MLWSKVPFSEVGSPAHAALALKAARESMVLLKNSNNTLPLSPSKIKTIAVIGPNAAELSAIEGNYNAVPKDPVLPVDGIVKQFPSAKVLYAQGSPYAENAGIVIPRTQFRTAAGSNVEGLKGEYFNNDSLTGPPVLTRTDKQIDFDWNSTSPDPAKLDPKAFSVRWTGTLQAPAPGDYEVTGMLAHCYPCNNSEHYTIRFDGKDMLAFQVSEDKAQHGSTTTAVKLHFDDTKPHAFEVTYAHRARLFGAGLSLQWVAPVEPLRAQALDIIKQSDVVLAFVGLSPNLEGEEMPVHIPGFSGGDRTDIALPAAQQQLLEAAKATGKPLVVVLMNGSALAVNWAQQNADAILEAWYPGDGGSQAIAETLAGANNPAGRLPITFYTGLDQLPALRRLRHGQPHLPLLQRQAPLRIRLRPQLHHLRLLQSQTLHHQPPRRRHPHRRSRRQKHRQARRRRGRRALPHAAPHRRLPQPRPQRLHPRQPAPGETKHITFTLDPRTLSQVDDKGVRAVTPGSYRIARRRRPTHRNHQHPNRHLHHRRHAGDAALISQ